MHSTVVWRHLFWGGHRILYGKGICNGKQLHIQAQQARTLFVELCTQNVGLGAFKMRPRLLLAYDVMIVRRPPGVLEPKHLVACLARLCCPLQREGGRSRNIGKFRLRIASTVCTTAAVTYKQEQHFFQVLKVLSIVYAYEDEEL